ncbi:unnamed protein product [Calypogeia fissa]
MDLFEDWSSRIASSQDFASWEFKPHAVQLNDSVYELYKPSGTSSVQIVFFHGLQDSRSYDEHLSTWQSRDGSCIWPQTWLVEEFPSANVLSVNSYFYARKVFEFDLYGIAETLLSDLVDAKVGQASDCPVVLVAHSIGGLFVKQLCYLAYEKLNISDGFHRAELENFLGNMRGIFFYATPHNGISVAENLGKYLNLPLTEYFKLLSRGTGLGTGLLNYKFQEMCKVHYDWLLVGIGETLPTKLGKFNTVIVPEASARFGNEFNVVQDSDHFSICRPRGKASPSFSKLREFLCTIEQRLKVQQLRDRGASRKNEEKSRGDRPNIDKQRGEVDDDGNDNWYDDPILKDIMCDPVNCSDGRTYDRWTIVDHKLSKAPFDPSLTTFSILCDDCTARSRLFKAYPEQETIFRERRRKYREEALQHARADPIEFEDAIEKLNNVVKWKPLDVECKKMLDTVLSLVSQQESQQESILDDIPVVNHEDVIGARLESEGARLVMFLGVTYVIVMLSFSMQW